MNFRNNLIHHMNLLDVGTTNYNRLAAVVFLKAKTTAQRIKEPSNYDRLLLNVRGKGVNYDKKM